MTKVQAIKEFFGQGSRPVTNQEMIELRKADPKGFDEVGLACLKALGQSEEGN